MDTPKHEIVSELLRGARLEVASVTETGQSDQFVVELTALPGSWAGLEKALLGADFALIGWRNSDGYHCLIRDIAYTVEKHSPRTA